MGWFMRNVLRVQIPLSYNVRSLMVRRATTIATALGIGLVVFVFAAVQMLSQGIKRTLGASGRPDVAIILSKGTDAELGSNLTKKQIDSITAKPGVAQSTSGAPLAVAEIVVVVTLPKNGTDGVSNVTLRGVALPENPDTAAPAGVVDAMTFRQDLPVKIVAGRAARAGTREVMIGKAIRGRFAHLELGDHFELRENQPLDVVGVFSAGGSALESEIWADFGQTQDIFGRKGLASSLRVKMTSAAAFTDFRANIEADPDLGNEVMRETVYYAKQSSNLSTFIMFLGMFIAIFFSVGAMIGAMITMYASVANRKREIGTLRALGFSRFGILLSFLIEATFLAIVGGAIGSVGSLAMGMVKFSTMNFGSWSEVVFTFVPTTGIMVGALVFSSVMGLVGGFFPALRAARVSPIEAMRA